MKARNLKILCLVLGIVSIFSIFVLKRSYALFENDIEAKKISVVVGNLNYSFILDEDIEKGIYVDAGGYKVVHIELSSTNEIDSKYAFVYKTTANVKVGYIESSDKLVTSPSTDTIKPNETKQIYLAIHNQNNNAVRLEISLRGGLVNNDVDVENGFTRITEKASDVYKDSVLNGTDPVLGEGMIPITLSRNGTVHYASLYSEWYSYAGKEWANAVILVNKPSKTYQVGDIIEEKDIQSYFVWIPRYRYKLFNLESYSTAVETLVDKKDDTDDATHNILGSAKLIDIQFETKEKVTQNKEGECAPDNTSGGGTNCKVGNYMTHPAFVSLNVDGFWVGKFETGYNQSTDTNSPITTTSGWTIAGAQQNKKSEANVIVKPNVYSWRNITVGNIFNTALNYKRDLGSHMMKNTEWGAVAYLAQSGYGIGNEIRINNNSEYKTGYSSAPNLDQSSYQGKYGNTLDMTQPYNTPIGYLASTTGNITGIYDMAGGTHEYMASYMEGYADKNSQNITSGITSSDLTTYAKYFDIYSKSSSWRSYNYRILGDATGEMGPFYYYYDIDGNKRNHNAWFADASYFVEAAYPWVHRGGPFSYGVLAGQFYFSRYTGGVYAYIGSRLVLAQES